MSRRARLAVAFGLVVWVVGCGVTEPPVDRLQVSVTLSEPVMRVGDTTKITVRAENPTSQLIEFSTNACVLVVTILDPRGEEVFPGGVPCNDILRPHSLRPGEALVEVVDFDGWGRRGWREEAAPFPLTPGTYEVRGAVGSSRDNPSQPVALEIVPGG